MSSPRAYGGPGAPWEPECVGLQSCCGDSERQRAYNARMEIAAKHYLTIVRPEDADWIIERLAGRYEGKIVIEVGAGIGILATRLAEKARHVYAIEADPMWNFIYAKYAAIAMEPSRDPESVLAGPYYRPTNLTWINGRAQDVYHMFERGGRPGLFGDLAICVTGSDEGQLRHLCHCLAADVCMPWQDWESGKARVPWHFSHPDEPVPR